ncbi:MAG: uroporphyrinogen decarboxylase [Halanaerobiaceae bacterium]|jgi:uroporphyrinogen decarboxylase|nr:uroporphyrinogen decarboxylase [Halanaerobiaceae bacterium]
MKLSDWDILCKVANCEKMAELPIAFIIDSPWLPWWTGINTLDYYTRDDVWFEVNMKAIEAFLDIIFLPGFWAEYGMGTQTSAFGSKIIWQQGGTPSPGRVIYDLSEVDRIKKPNSATDGLLPFVLNRIENNRKKIEGKGHYTKFAFSWGPFNIAAYLVGHTEFFVGLKIYPEETKKLIEIVTEHIIDWIRLQKERIDSIEGIFVLDDIIGFINEEDFVNFALPPMKEIFAAIDSKVNFLHNDMESIIPAKYLEEMGVNLYNFSHIFDFNTMREVAGDSVALLGNLPPRDVLADGTAEEVENETIKMLDSISSFEGILLSCGGVVPPGASSENLNSFVKAVKEYVR